MKMKAMSLLKWFNVFLTVAVLGIATGCAQRDYPRGQFQGYVLGMTEAEIVEKVGNPVEVDRSNPDKPVLIFKAKTFDVDNYNKPDPKTRVFLEKKDGKIIAVDVVFG